MSDTITIGVDHGYAAMKTTHCAFPTGLVGYEKWVDFMAAYPWSTPMVMASLIWNHLDSS